MESDWETEHIIVKEKVLENNVVFEFYKSRLNGLRFDKNPKLCISIDEKIFEFISEEWQDIKDAIHSYDSQFLGKEIAGQLEYELKEKSAVYQINMGFMGTARNEFFYVIDLSGKTVQEIEPKIGIYGKVARRVADYFSENSLKDIAISGILKLFTLCISSFISIYSSVIPKIAQESSTIGNPLYSSTYPLFFSAAIAVLALTAYVSKYSEKITFSPSWYKDGIINPYKIGINSVGYGIAFGLVFPNLLS